MEFLSWAQLILRSIQFITKQRCVFINMGYEWVKGARVSFRISDNMETWKKVIFGKYQLKVPITISPSHMYARKYSNWNKKNGKISVRFLLLQCKFEYGTHGAVQRHSKQN